MNRAHRALVTSALIAALVVMPSACGDSASPSDDEFTGDLTADIGSAQADEVEESVGALTAGEPSGMSLRRASFAGGGAVASLQLRYAGCATVDNTTDSDGDGAPDEATFTFALPACSFTGFRGGELEITGTVVVSDPTPNSADFAYHVALDDFRLQFTSPNAARSYTATRNGTRALTGDASSVALSNNVTTVRSVTGRADATISHNTLLTFTVDQGGTLAIGEPLPDGTFSFAGTLIWSRGARSHTFTATTVVPLHWDADCTTDRKIDAGELRWTRSNGSYIRVVWTGCGEDPTVEFVPASEA